MAFPPERAAQMRAQIDAQLADPAPAPSAEGREEALGRQELRAFLTSPQMVHGARLLREICFGGQPQGTTATEYGLMALGMRAVWDTAMDMAFEPDPEPAGDKQWEHET